MNFIKKGKEELIKSFAFFQDLGATLIHTEAKT